MTGENRRRNIADEVTRADVAYRSAEILQQAGQHAEQQYRRHADYTAAYVFTATTAADELDAAKTFCNAARQVLVTEAWIER